MMLIYIFVSALSAGQPLLSAKHCASAHHQTEGDPPSRVESLHEGGQSHPHPRAPAGYPVRLAPLQARGTGFL